MKSVVVTPDLVEEWVRRNPHVPDARELVKKAIKLGRIVVVDEKEVPA